MSEKKKILIFNVNWLGDVLFSTAAIRNIRYNFPDSFIACVVPLSCYLILEGNPNLNEIIIFDEKGLHRSISAKLKFIKSLKRKKFDAVFLLHRSFTRAFICWLAGVPERIGYHTLKRSFLLTKKIQFPPKDKMHRIDYYLNIIAKSGLKVKDRFSEFFIPDDEHKFIDDFLNQESVKKDDFLVGLNPGGNWGPKRWSKEKWAKLADRLIDEFFAKVIITGSHADTALVKDIQNLMVGKPILACVVLNLKQLGALLKRLDLFITADTGPLHIANSMGAKRIIALFGPTHPAITGPYPVNNVIVLFRYVGCKVPCYVKRCKNNRCMQEITVDEVLTEIGKFKN